MCGKYSNETKMLIFQSMANLEVKMLFGYITHFIDTEIRKMLEKALYGNQDSTFHSGPIAMQTKIHFIQTIRFKEAVNRNLYRPFHRFETCSPMI